MMEGTSSDKFPEKFALDEICLKSKFFYKPCFSASISRGFIFEFKFIFM